MGNKRHTEGRDVSEVLLKLSLHLRKLKIFAFILKFHFHFACIMKKEQLYVIHIFK